MFNLMGILVLFVMVFAPYMLHGGNMKLILIALPFELAMIFGAAVGAMLIGNSSLIVKKTMKAIPKSFKGPKWSRQDYIDLMTMLYGVTKKIKSSGLMSIEQDIEKPQDSQLFNKYSKFLDDYFVVPIICDTLRMAMMNLEDPYQIEDHIERILKKVHQEQLKGYKVIYKMSDALPALGIVAAVLGVIKTMSSIDQPVEILGKMIGGALVGTFLGVFLAYGLVGPIAIRNEQVVNEEMQFYYAIRDALVSHFKQNPPQISVELARANIPTHLQPTFAEVEEALNAAG